MDHRIGQSASERPLCVSCSFHKSYKLDFYAKKYSVGDAFLKRYRTRAQKYERISILDRYRSGSQVGPGQNDKRTCRTIPPFECSFESQAFFVTRGGINLSSLPTVGHPYSAAMDHYYRERIIARLIPSWGKVKFPVVLKERQSIFQFAEQSRLYEEDP